MQYTRFVQSVSCNIVCTAWYPFIMRCCSKYVFNLLCQLRSLLWFQCKSDFVFIICTCLSLFGSTYITLMAQNSKTIRIIFLPKCTKKLCFYAFLHVFLRISVLSGKTKSTLAMIFIGYFHINLHWWIFPLFNSAKNHTKDGHQSLARKVLEILIPIVSLFIFMLIFSQICDILVSFWMHGYGSNL